MADQPLPQYDSEILLYLKFKAELRNFVAEKYAFKILSDLRRKKNFFDTAKREWVKVNHKRLYNLMMHNFDKNKKLYRDTWERGLKLIWKEYELELWMQSKHADQLREDLK